MKQLKKDLQAVSKTLRQLTRKTEKIAKRLDKLEKTKPTRKAKRRVARKPKPKARAKVTKRSATASPSGAVLAIIKRSRKGVDVPTLKNKTGLEGRRVNDIIYRLKKEGKIKSSGRGIYVKT
jgi:predicted Rossmann fold nucleotide-binding protein DprA/Smf involved in DNA uptake